MLARLVVNQRHGLDDSFLVGEYGQVVSLTIAEALARCGDTANGDGGQFVGLDSEVDRLGFFRRQQEVVFFRVERLHGGWVYQLHFCLAFHFLLGGVAEAGGEHAFVSLAQEAGHVGLYHHVLACHDLSIYHAVTHVLVMGDAHHAPCSDALGQGEAQGDMALAVCFQVGIEEGSLLQVLPQLGIVARGFFRFRPTATSILHGQGFGGGRGGSRYHRLLHQHNVLVSHRIGAAHGSRFHRAKKDAWAWEILLVEGVEAQGLLLHILIACLFLHACAPHSQVASPQRERQARLQVELHLPLVGIELVERFVIEHAHQLCLGGRAVGVGDAQCPFLFLSGSESVAEGHPLHVEPLVGQGALHREGMVV